MPKSHLPERPDLAQLKRQAKDLLRAATAGRTAAGTHATDRASSTKSAERASTAKSAGRTSSAKSAERASTTKSPERAAAEEAAALERFRILPAFAHESIEALRGLPLALHDAQSVIAREHGFESWKALRARVEELSLGLDEAVVQFVEAATEGRADRAERLLELLPAIARANLHTALVLGDAEAVESHLSRDPSLATTAGGPRGWEPLLYVCHTALHRGERARPDGLAAIARRLISLGADPDTRFPWLHHGVRRPALWGATLATRQLPLAAALLEAGADPDDGVTLPLLAAAGDLPALELLCAHGADPDQPWATDGSPAIYAALTWAHTSAGVEWLLDNGADPDPVFSDNGESPMHVVARRWDARLAARFAERGADLVRRRADGRTPFAVATLNGNHAVADWLEEHGASSELADVDRLVALCSRGDRAAAEGMLEARPELRAEIGPEHHGALLQAAERGDTSALDAMLACGFDPGYQDDEIGKTALHCAAMEGWPDAVRTLLAHGASVDVRDKEFDGNPLVWAAEGSRGHRRAERDHAAVARLLLDAGSSADWQTGEEPAESIVEVLAEWRRAHAQGT